jgi:hypothetical protein
MFGMEAGAYVASGAYSYAQNVRLPRTQNPSDVETPRSIPGVPGATTRPRGYPRNDTFTPR